MANRNFAATAEAARAWELLEEGQFPESLDKRPPVEMGLSHDQAVLLHIDKAKEAHLVRMGKLDRARPVERAAKRLAIILSNGPKPAEEVRRLAKGFSAATLRRAKNRLGVRVRREGFGRLGRYIWEIR